MYEWLRRYREQGIQGLRHKPGKGRKPAFAPLSEEDAESELQDIVYRDPSVLPLLTKSYLAQLVIISIDYLQTGENGSRDREGFPDISSSAISFPVIGASKIPFL